MSKVEENKKNYPTAYDDFWKNIKANTSTDANKKAQSYLKAFSYRYRFAKSFECVKLEDYTESTESGYSEEVRLFLTYTAFERVWKVYAKILKLGVYNPKDNPNTS